MISSVLQGRLDDSVEEEEALGGADGNAKPSRKAN